LGGPNRSIETPASIAVRVIEVRKEPFLIKRLQCCFGLICLRDHMETQLRDVTMRKLVYIDQPKCLLMLPNMSGNTLFL